MSTALLSDNRDRNSDPIFNPERGVGKRTRTSVRGPGFAWGDDDEPSTDPRISTRAHARNPGLPMAAELRLMGRIDSGIEFLCFFAPLWTYV